MNSPGAIRHKLKQVSYRHLKRKLEQDLVEVPNNCIYNISIMDPYQQAHARFPVPVQMCIHPEVELRLCDPEWGGCEKAKSCPHFQTHQDKDEIKEEFKEFIRSAPLHEIAAEYPDVAALLWVLSDDAPDREDPLPRGFATVVVGPVTAWTETPEEAEAAGEWLHLQKSKAEKAIASVESKAQGATEAATQLQERLNELRDQNQALREKEPEAVPLETALQESWTPEAKIGVRAWLIRILGGTP